MRRREATRAVVGVLERLTLQPASRILTLLMMAPISEHAAAISALGPDAEQVRAVGGDPDPVCTIAVLPIEQPIHPDTGPHAVARACLDYLEVHHARGDLRGMAPELELRLGQLAQAAREDLLQAVARQRGAQ